MWQAAIQHHAGLKPLSDVMPAVSVQDGGRGAAATGVEPRALRGDRDRQLRAVAQHSEGPFHRRNPARDQRSVTLELLYLLFGFSTALAQQAGVLPFASNPSQASNLQLTSP